MLYLLAASLLINAALIAASGRLWLRCHGKPLPRRKPDFDAIELALTHELKRRSLDDVVELTRFERRDWICRATLTHRVADIHAHWSEILSLLQAVSRQCNLPARPAGWAFDPTEPDRMTGTLLEFGYSPEVGYHHHNEFASDAALELPARQDAPAGQPRQADPRITIEAMG